MNKTEIKIGTIGKILEGDYSEWFLFIERDIEKSGGYLILISQDPKMSKYAEGYDYWVEDKETLIKMFSDFRWKIKWLERS